MRDVSTWVLIAVATGIVASSVWVLFEELRLRRRVAASADAAVKTYPLQWAVLCLAVWFVFFPLYLFEHHRAVVARLLHREPTLAHA